MKFTPLRACVGALRSVVAFGLALVTLLVAGAALALEVPALRGRVNDYANLLPDAARQDLETRLAVHEAKTGHQFAVLTIPSLEGEVLEDFSIKTVQRWRLGHSKLDDGLLLLVAQKEHKVRIEVGYGLEGTITDALSSRIIRNTIVPEFRRGNYATGIEQGMAAVLAADGDAQPGVPVPYTPPSLPGLPVLFPFLLFAPVLGLILWLRRGGGGSGGYRGGYWGGYGGGYGGGGSWGGGGGGGGGGFSGGGGGFGGGGASGSW